MSARRYKDKNSDKAESQMADSKIEASGIAVLRRSASGSVAIEFDARAFEEKSNSKYECILGVLSQCCCVGNLMRLQEIT